MTKKIVVLLIVLMAIIGLSGIAVASVSVDNNKKDIDKGTLIVGDKGKVVDKGKGNGVGIGSLGKGKGIGKNRRKH